MKTVTRNIQLPEELDHFAQSEVEAGAYSSLSEYVRQLLRQRREAQIAADVKLLGKAIRTASDEEEAVAELVETTRKVREQMRREGWKPGE
jgi:antitoxin ParD1/3/4